MTCDQVALPNGARAIVCSSRKRERCACGRTATRLCDWKVPTKKSGTCDTPICSRCTFHPAADKDLCPAHRAAFDAWREQQRLQSDSNRGGEPTKLAPAHDRPAVAPAGTVLSEGACP